MAATMTASASHGWLRNPGFDLFFILGISVIALVSGAAVLWNNDLFLPILEADLWLLGYHHVVATYTRLAFDRHSFAEHKALIVYLFPAVALAVVLLAMSAGIWLIPTIYLYWQWWHYTRQSEGISKAYAGKAKDRDLGHPLLRRAIFWSLPITGILAVSSRSPGEFLYFPLRTLPVAPVVVEICIAISAILLTVWFVQQVSAWRAGRIALPYVLYVASHFVIYAVAYVLITTLDYGWLVINIWHNAQYILFVWLYNNRRFNGKVRPAQLFLSTISQNGRFLLYTACCLTISTFVYFLIAKFVADAITQTFAITATMTAMVIYQTINFHHYIVDSLIWKLRKPKLRSNLGIA